MRIGKELMSSMKRTMGFAAAILVAAAFWYGCSDEDAAPTSPPPTMEIEWLTILPNLISQSDNYAQVRVAVTGANPQDVDSVKAFIQDSLSAPVNEFHLYDDANAFILTNALDFCSDHSGDNVSNDGIYSRMVNSRFADSTEGTYHFTVKAWIDENTAETSSASIVVASSQPPVLSGLNFPDELISGFPPTQIYLQVYDPDPAAFDSITMVSMHLYSSSQTFLDSFQLEPLDNAANYGTLLTPDIAVGCSTDTYTFTFRAWDSFNVISNSLGKEVNMINLAPHLENSILPDMITLPVGDTTAFPIMITCWDDQTIADIAQVTVQALKPDTSWGTEIDLFDDGDLIAHGDTTEGDSVYSRIVEIWPSNMLGLYQFYFRGEDKAGNQSELIDTLWVVP